MHRLLKGNPAQVGVVHVACSGGRAGWRPLRQVLDLTSNWAESAMGEFQVCPPSGAGCVLHARGCVSCFRSPFLRAARMPHVHGAALCFACTRGCASRFCSCVSPHGRSENTEEAAARASTCSQVACIVCTVLQGHALFQALAQGHQVRAAGMHRGLKGSPAQVGVVHVACSGGRAGWRPLRQVLDLTSN